MKILDYFKGTKPIVEESAIEVATSSGKHVAQYSLEKHEE